MRKISLFCAALLACGSLTACGNQSASNSKKNSSISSLKAENSSLKAKKSSSHSRKHRKNIAGSSSQVTKSSSSTSGRTANSNGSKEDAKEAQAAKAMHDYDPEWWDSLSPEEQQYWAHHTAYGSNEDFMYEPRLYARHAYPVYGGGSDSQNNSGSVDYGGNSQSGDVGSTNVNSCPSGQQ